MGNKNDILYINEYITGLEASVRGERMPPISPLKISAAYYLSVHFVHISQTLMKQIRFFKKTSYYYTLHRYLQQYSFLKKPKLLSCI